MCQMLACWLIFNCSGGYESHSIPGSSSLVKVSLVKIATPNDIKAYRWLCLAAWIGNIGFESFSVAAAWLCQVFYKQFAQIHASKN